MDVCNLLRINSTIFDGFLIPETISDALIFFSTEIIDSNNIPYHIKHLQTYVDRNQQVTDEIMIDVSNKNWLIGEIKIQLERNERKQKLIKDVLTKIFILCIDNFDIYRNITSLTSTLKQKLDEVLDLKTKLNSNSLDLNVILKAEQLKELHETYSL